MASKFNLSQPLYYVKDHFPERYFPDTIFPTRAAEGVCDQLQLETDYGHLEHDTYIHFSNFSTPNELLSLLKT